MPVPVPAGHGTFRYRIELVPITDHPRLDCFSPFSRDIDRRNAF